MPSLEHETLVGLLKSLSPFAQRGLEDLRSRFEQLARLMPLPGDVATEPVTADGVPAEWIRLPESRPGDTLLYLHGGGYVLGSIDTHRELIARIARAGRARALAVDYRLAPEHPFPAALEDATAAYRWLLAQGIEPGRIVVAGDSAGGGLTLATLLALRDAGDPLPAAGVCLSPWTDLEGTGASAQPGAVDDPLIDVEGLRQMGRHYAPDGQRRAPLAAPLYGEYRDLPPLLIQVGTREVLLDDATRVAERARAAGVDVTLEPWEGLVHVWPLFGPALPESQQAVARIGEFVRKQLA